MQAHPLSSPAARNVIPTPAPFVHPLPTAVGPPGVVDEGAGLAHDAGNLLGAIGLYCDLLDLPGVLRPEHRHYAAELRQLSQRSHALIARLLGDTVTPPTPPCRPAAGAGQTLLSIAPLLRSVALPDAQAVVEPPPALPPLPFDAEVLERILVNLTRNAASALRGHTPADGARPHVRISMKARLSRRASDSHPASLRLTVEDNGPGMLPALAAAFMDPSPLPHQATHGLGHRIVHTLLCATGGRMNIVVAPGRGTAIRIDWPLQAAVSPPKRLAARLQKGRG
jgi:nitrogen-specific signal transduction histidine kinase